MRKEPNTESTVPTTSKDTAGDSKADGVSRRDFISLTAAAGVASAGITSMAPSAAASTQENRAPTSQNALPTSESVYMYEGTAAGAVLEQLRAAGIRMLFHTNTSGFVPLWEAIHAAGDVQVINLTHEGQAVAAAAGYAMASKTLGFFFGSDAGVGNATSNLYCAWKDRVPMIVTFSGGGLSGQGKDGAEHWDDQLGPTKPFTMWTGSLLTNEMTDIIRRSIKFAFGPPSGPVTLLWGEAQANQQVRAPIYNIDLATARHTFRGKPDLIEKAAQWLAEAENPVFVVGPEITEDGAHEEIRALAEKLSVPVTELGWPNEGIYANFPTDHTLFLGKLNALRFPRDVDLVINFGEKFGGRDGPIRGTPTVHISHDPDILGRQSTDLNIASDVRVAIRDISDALDGILTRDRMARIRSGRLTEVTELTSKLRQSRELALRGRFDFSPLSWERVGYELEQVLDRDAVIVPEIGTQHPKLLGQLTFGPQNKLRVGRTTGSALGWGVGAALGVSLALPQHQVVAVQGDGGFLFGQTETLWSISRYEAPMLIVVMNNRVYNDSRVRNMSSGGPLYEAGRDYNGHLGNPDIDFTKIAEAYNLSGEKVKTPSDLAPALQRAVRSMRNGRAVVLDVDIEPDGQQLSDSTWYQRYSIADVGNNIRLGNASNR